MSISSTGTVVDAEIQTLKDALKEVRYGEVGLIFTLHDGGIVRIKQVRVKNCKVIDHADGVPGVADKTTEETSYLDVSEIGT
jgi:hypothetical protein